MPTKSPVGRFTPGIICRSTLFSAILALAAVTHVAGAEPNPTDVKPNDPRGLAQEFLSRMANGAEPTEIAALFSEDLDWEIAGDTGVLPWIGKKMGRAAIADFVRDSRALVERISFDVQDILVGNGRAVILGSLATRINRTGKVIRSDFVIVLTIANGQIIRFRMLENSFAVSQAARG